MLIIPRSKVSDQMRKLKNTFFTVLGITSVLLFVFLANDIYQENERVQKIKGVDAKVIKQLNKIRMVQEAYLSVNKSFCDSWDTLSRFIAEDKFVIIQKKEIINTVNGVDKVTFQIDTMASVLVFDSLQNELGLKTISEIDQLWRVPVSDTLFTLRADMLSNGQPICEVRDPFPLNPARQKDGSMKPLQIGSLEVSTLQGNWE